MRKLTVLLLFLATGLPAERWALPEAWWNKVDAVLPPELLQYSTQLAQQPAAWFELYIRTFAVAWLGIFLIDLIANQSIGAWSLGKDGRGFEAVDEAVPHARFRRTEDGFKVIMRNNDGLGGGFLLFFLTIITAGVRRNPEAKALLEELRRIGNNLNQLAHHANAVGMLREGRELRGTITQLKAAMERVLGL